MKEELDAMLLQLAAEKTQRGTSKASIGLEGVGEWVQTRENKQVCSDGPLDAMMHVDIK